MSEQYLMLQPIEFISLGATINFDFTKIYCCCPRCFAKIHNNMFTKSNYGRDDYDESEYKLCKYTLEELPILALVIDVVASLTIIYKKKNENRIYLSDRSKFIILMNNTIRIKDRLIECERGRRGYLEVLPNDIWNIITSYICVTNADLIHI